MTKKKSHGGKRPGSGRKPTGRVPYLIRMKPAAMNTLRTKALRAKKDSVGELLEDLAVAK